MRRQEKERKDYEALMEQSKQLEIENLKERQALQRRDQQQKHIEEEERYIREHDEAKRLRENRRPKKGAGEERKSQGGAAAPKAGKVMGSRFFAPTVSRFLKAEAAVSRFLVRHPKVSRFIAHIPGASKFLQSIAHAIEPAVALTPHVAPVYNAHARKPRPPTFRM